MKRPDRRSRRTKSDGSGNPTPLVLSVRARLLLALVGVILGVLVATVAELGLRAASYGPDLRVFERSESLGREYWVLNRDVSLRYFPPEMARPPGFERFPVVKDPNTYRIFSLGASSTLADPFGPQASFTAFLGEMLTDLHPGKTFELVNCGIIAISSADVLDLVPEVLKKEPDALLIYVGHNEAYGADAVLSGLRGSVTNRSWMKLRIRARRLRLGFLAQDVMRKIRGSGDPAAKQFGMDLMEGKVLPRDGGLHERMLDIYRGNIEEMLDLARQRGVAVILCTPVANLRDQSPFGSAHGAGAVVGDGWEASFEAGRRAMGTAQWETALQALGSATALDSSYAELRFRQGRCLDALARGSGGNPGALGADPSGPEWPEDARVEYQAALDLDTVHFRACSDEVRVLRELVASRNDPNCVLVDLVEDLREASPDGIPGREFMTEHVHPTTRGHAFLAERICRTLAGSAPGAGMGSWDFSRLGSAEEYMRRMGLDATDEVAGLLLTVEHKTNKWPFTQAYENRLAVTELERKVRGLTSQLDPFSLQVISEIRAGRFVDGFDYGLRHQEIARRALQANQTDLALRELRKCESYWGPLAETTTTMAQARLMKNEFAPTDSLLDLAAQLNPDFPRVRFVRGMLRRMQGRPAEARAEFEAYLQLEATGIFADAARQLLRQTPG